MSKLGGARFGGLGPPLTAESFRKAHAMGYSSTPIKTFLICFSLCISCMAPRYALPIPVTSTEGVTPERVSQVAMRVKERLPELRLEEIKIVVDGASRSRYCAGATDACTSHVRNKGKPFFSVVHVPWQRDGAPQQLLAHELCHVYYFQTRNDADGGHKHRECFDDVAKRL